MKTNLADLNRKLRKHKVSQLILEDKTVLENISSEIVTIVSLNNTLPILDNSFLPEIQLNNLLEYSILTGWLLRKSSLRDSYYFVSPELQNEYKEVSLDIVLELDRLDYGVSWAIVKADNNL